MTRSTQSRSLALRITAALLAAPIALSPILSTPAAAQWIVYDPTNYAQNVLTAARTLQQVNQQITQLQNEATMLINQARNLASLPYSSLQQLQQSVQRTQQLLQQAQGIAYDVQRIDQAFTSTYGNASMSASDQALVAQARERWQNTVGGLQDAMRVQAGVVGNIDTNRAARRERCRRRRPATSFSRCKRSSLPISPPSLPPTAGRKACPRPSDLPRPNRVANSADGS